MVRAFSAKRVEALCPRICQIADELLEAIATRTEVDLVADYAFPLPVRVICEILGIPGDVRALLLQAATKPGNATMLVPPDAVERVLPELIDARWRHTTDDLISALVTATVTSNSPRKNSPRRWACSSRPATPPPST